MVLRTAAAMVLLASGSALAQGISGYYRQPCLHAETVVFVSEGDLWKVPVSGGVAKRLTTHAGDEGSPRISGDGQWLAFTGQYEGPTEVYVMPVAGGLPRRLTFDAARAAVVGWKGGRVVASTSRFSTLPAQQLTLIDPSNGQRTLVPLAQAADGSFDDDGRTLFFTRLAPQGSQTKRYKGGTAQNLWSFTEGAAEAVPLTADYAGTSANPMWWKGRLYFASDRDGTMDIWSMRATGDDLRQHTNHEDPATVLLDVKGPSLWGGRIVYQLGADLWLHDIESGTSSPIPITLESDLDQTRENWVDKPMDYLSAAHLSHDGEKVAMTVRGQIFVAPRGFGRLVEATRRDGVRYRDGRFLPGSDRLVALSDESGEVEVWTLPSGGEPGGEQLTTNGDVLRFETLPSPDGKWIAHHDKHQRLWMLDTTTKEQKQVDSNPFDNFGSIAWSPDSSWLAYTNCAPNTNRIVKIYHPATGKSVTVTTDRFDTHGVSWSPDGQWLYFLSDRHIRSVIPSPWGAMAPEPLFDRRTRLYQLALKPGQRSQFWPEDELNPKSKDESSKKNGEPKDGANGPESGPDKPSPGAEGEAPEKKDAGGAPVEIVEEGLAERLIEVPIPPGNYRDLTVGAKRIFLTQQDLGFDTKVNLMSLDIGNTKIELKTLVPDIEAYELSGDGKSLLVRRRDAMWVIAASASAPASLEDKQVKLAGWKFSLTPREEWRQMFREAWRLERDYFYAQNMHGVDWNAMLERYKPLVDRVATRAELNDLISQMVAELAALHIFVRGGDQRQGEDQIAAASLGAHLVRDEAAGGYRIERVYRTDPDHPELLPPLAHPAVGAKDGDVIVEINGRPALSLHPIDGPGAVLRNQVGRQVLLKLKNAEGERRVVVTPISAAADADLRYHEWQYTRRQRVEELGGGDIGYVHLRAMGGENMAEFARGFYPVFNRKGLIIDVRNNRGGNIDSWVLSRLMRKAWFFWQPRVGATYWNMQYAFRGHIAVLCNESTASDGEAFAEGIKRLNLGTVIGTRTWGGEIWLSSSNFLVDGGIATAAEVGVYGPEGEWLIEGHGVEPDVVVDNLPHATFKGEDAQLAAAIEHLKRKISQEPVEVPPPPPHPDKSFPPNAPR